MYWTAKIIENPDCVNTPPPPLNSFCRRVVDGLRSQMRFFTYWLSCNLSFIIRKAFPEKNKRFPLGIAPLPHIIWATFFVMKKFRVLSCLKVSENDNFDDSRSWSLGPFLVPPKMPKMGHFGCFWRFWGYRKWHFGCPNQNSKTTFQYKYPP